jgi:glycosyltransferase involved in cell wall biosynthesis
MKIRIFLSHPSSQLFGEKREAVIAQDLVRLGHDARVYRVFEGTETKRELHAGCVQIYYFPADDRHAPPHRTVSSALLAALANDLPDIIIFKGAGYDIVSYVLGSPAVEQAKIGFILGGDAVDPELTRANFVLAESESQIAAIRGAVGNRTPCRTLAKFIDWDTAEKAYAERQSRPSDYDIVNVGSFELRKNQMALKCFFGSYRIAMVGVGEMQSAVIRAAQGHDRVTFLGALPNAQTLEVMGRSRLMVHCSHWEGLPRALLESLACGTPVVVLEGSIQESFDETDAVQTTTEDGLRAKVERLLAHEMILDLMSKEGRRYARARHGPERLAEAAAQLLVMATGHGR